ncbi:hypothetical protein [Psychrobacter urativorans]|uniref:Uncharacterized protein n=1 Tax=Psychrobacter urativorans TaxID=45610 RepID=A0A0M5MJV9_9GAMM|nr:hypothetical protein [Psychrobacter urativorans]ALF60112.1 hypothetical protein AOC03_08740 [Psychrobacter urativorans]
MAPYLRLDDRLRFYQDVIKTLFNHDVGFGDRLRFIHEYKLPVTLVSIADQMHLISAKKPQLTLFDYRSDEVTALMQAFEIEGFFDGWDILLIFSYMEYVNAQVEFLPIHDEFERTELIDILAFRLYRMMEELEESVEYLATDLKNKSNGREDKVIELEARILELENDYDSENECRNNLEENFKNFLNTYIHNCHQRYDTSKIKDNILNKVKAIYCSLTSLDDEFSNMYEFLGCIVYHGGDHSLCEMMHEKLRDEIENEFDELIFSEKVALVDEYYLDYLIDDIDISSLEDISEFHKLVSRGDAFYNVTSALKTEFLSGVPSYDPYD